MINIKKFAPTSESSKDQLQLFNEFEDIIDCDDEEEESTEVKTYTRKRGKRKPLPENLRGEDDVFDIPESEKEGMKFIGDEISEQLIIKPANIYVKRTIRKKYAPIDIGSDKKMITATAPEKLLLKTMASSSLIAYIITAKYVDALPLYRMLRHSLEVISKRYFLKQEKRKSSVSPLLDSLLANFRHSLKLEYISKYYNMN